MVQPTQLWWDEQLDFAEAFDETCAERSKTWPPPIMAELVSVASRTDLVRLCPFISHNVLRFATSPRWYVGEGSVAPAFIALFGNPDGYVVYSGELFGNADAVLDTANAADAAAKAAELLASWPANL